MHALSRLGGFALICLLLLVQGCTSSNELAPDERALLITAAEFAPFVKGSHDQTRGRFTKRTGWLDGSRELSYEFKFEAAENEPPLYVNCMINIQPRGDKTVARAAREVGL